MRVLGKTCEKRNETDKRMKETHDVIDRRFRLDLQAIIVTDLLPNLFAAASGAHLGAAAPTLGTVVTIFNEIETTTTPRSRVPVYEERCEIRAITSRMTPPSGGPVRPLFNYKLSISVL